MTEIFTERTGLGAEEELIVKNQMIALVQKDSLERSSQNLKLQARINSIKALPKVHMIGDELINPMTNLKILKLEIDSIMTEIHDSKTLEGLCVEDLAQVKKSLKLAQFNMDTIESLLNYMEREFKRKLRKSTNFILGAFLICTGIFFYIWLN